MLSETGYVPKYFSITEYLSISQAARAIGLSSEQTRRLVRSGKFKSLDTALGVLIDPASVDEFILERERAKRFAPDSERPSVRGGMWERERRSPNG